MDPKLSQHLERKFTFVASHRGQILPWLEHCCVPDPSYDAGPVSSIYFDTPSLRLYDEKRNGDFVKCKVRLRWYADLDGTDPHTDVDCYVEVKQKHGRTSRKVRMVLPVPAATLTSDPFAAEEILSLPTRIPELGHTSPGGLVPMLLVRYNRRRFVDPATTSRIALDTDICCTAVNQAFLPGIPPVYLDIGVLEIKGKQTDAFASLEPIGVHLTNESFSKYAQCFERLMQPIGRRV